jgi:fructose-specific phosphotransferase system IIC component
MLRQVLLARPNIFAILAGALVLIPCVLVRVAGGSLVDQAPPVLAAILTLLVFLVPGAIAGLIAPRSFFWNGAILGMIAAIFVTFNSFHFRLPNWQSAVLYETIGLLTCVTVTSCIVGALGGRFVRRRR